MTDDPWADQADVVAAVAGCTAAFARLYDAHKDRVYRHLYYRLSRAEEAEDLTQQVFLQAWQSIRRYRRQGSPFIAWLLTIAHNLVIDEYRAHARRSAVPLEIDVCSQDAYDDPELWTELRERQQQVHAALRVVAGRKPDQAQAVTEWYSAPWSPAVTARRMGKTEGNVRVLLHRGLQRMRTELERTGVTS